MYSCSTNTLSLVAQRRLMEAAEKPFLEIKTVRTKITYYAPHSAFHKNLASSHKQDIRNGMAVEVQWQYCTIHARVEF
jgi:hypothetical protein